MTNFRYDIETLLELVESKPCLWDKTCNGYKNRRLRDKSWNEIFNSLHVGYSDLSPVEKKRTGDLIIQKYTNVRDAFIKSLRSKRGKRRYLYAKKLQFLLNSIGSKRTNRQHSVNTGTSSESTQPVQPVAPPTPLLPETVSIERNSPPNKNHKSQKRRLDEIEMEILAEIKKPHPSSNAIHCCQSRKMDDKEIMLLSFIPYIKDMDENEMMDLHMEMLSCIWKIKQKRVSYVRISQRQNFSASESYSAYSNTEILQNHPATSEYSCENDLNAITPSLSSTHHKAEMENMF